jgi:competence protein ComEA
VAFPGVYELEEGSRIFQAVEVAGGFTENAAADSLNMAEPVKDGMELKVPDKEEAKVLLDQALYSGTGSSEGRRKVNLNTADKGQLMTLRGVGEAKADDIIRYRESHGGFQKIEDIMKISGIKEAAFLKIKDDITV